MTRLRLVTETNREQHVSGEILTHAEMIARLDLEEGLHLMAGWHVDRYGPMIRAEKHTTVRWIWPRSRSAMEDTL